MAAVDGCDDCLYLNSGFLPDGKKAVGKPYKLHITSSQDPTEFKTNSIPIAEILYQQILKSAPVKSHQCSLLVLNSKVK